LRTRGPLLSPVQMPDTDSTADAFREDVERCLEKAGKGDGAALRALYEKIGGRVYGHLRNNLINETDAAEVLQDVFSEIWRKANRFSASRGSGVSWIFTIARNRAIDRIRKIERTRDNLDRYQEKAVDPAVSPEPAPLEETQRHEDREELNLCLSGLAAETREVVSLAFFGSLPHREIAQKLNQPLGTIKARIRRGLLSLGDCLRRNGEAHG